MTDLDAISISPEASLLQAMAAIDAGAVAIALVIREGRLVGVVTDGDIRRALLRGASLAAPVEDHMNNQYEWTTPKTSRNHVIDLMKARSIHQIPVVDQGVVVGLHTLDDLLGTGTKPNAAVLMAGGRGTRLRPMTESIPKPMIPVAGRPILERLVLHLVGWGIERIYVSVNYLGDQIEDHFGDGAAFGCSITYLREEKPLDTGGSLSMLPRQEDAVLVMNGDLITQFDVEALLGAHRSGGHVATMAVRSHIVEVPFGVVETNSGRIENMVEKPSIEHLVNAGIYVLDPQVIERIPPDTPYKITDVFEHAIRAGDSVGAHLLDEDWIDIGRPSELARARGLTE